MYKIKQLTINNKHLIQGKQLILLSEYFIKNLK